METTPLSEEESLPLEMAYEENCARPNEVDSLDHYHHNSWYSDGRLASALCGLTVAVTDEQIHAIDMQRDRAFSDGYTYRKVQSLGNAAHTAWLCTDVHFDSWNAAFDEASIPEEERLFKAISVARQARIKSDEKTEMTIGIISRSCEGTIVTRDKDYTFDPAVDRATIIGVAVGGVSVAHFTLKPGLYQVYDERDLSTRHRLGELVDTAVLHDPYLTTNALLERAIDAQSLQMNDFGK